MVDHFLRCFGLSMVLLAVAAWILARDAGRRWLALALAAALLCAHAAIYLPGTVDDAFISFRFARNWAEGAGPVFQAGQRVEGYTSFAWVALLALAARIGADINVAAKALGLCFALATLPATYLLTERLTRSRRAAALAAMVLGVSPLYAAWVFAGMEAPAFAAVVAWAAWAIAREDRDEPGFPWSALLLGLSVWIRPEGFLFVAAGTFAVIGRRWERAGKPKGEAARSEAGGAGRRGRPGAGRAFWWLGVSIAAVLPFWIARWIYYGQFFPNTFYAKTRFSLEHVVPGLVATWEFLSYAGTALVALSLLAAGWLRGSGARFLAASLAAFTVYVIWAGGDVLHLRFFVHVLPLLAVAIAAGAGRLIEGVGKEPRGLKRPVLATALVVTWGLASFQQDWRAFQSIDQFGAGYVVNNSTAIQMANIPLGNWLLENARPDLRLACWDIGAIGYYSRLPIVDLFGLTDAHIARLRRGPDGPQRVEAYVESLAPELIATYSGLDSTAVDWIPSGRSWLETNYRYHSKWRDQGPGSGPALLVRKDVSLPNR